MKIRFLMAAALAATALTANPAAAQRSAVTYGNYTDVSAIKILPGHFEDYMDFLKTNFVKQQEWAKSKGYIVSFKILANAYPREGEPTVYLITEYKDVPSNAEARRRQEEFIAMMKMDEHQMDMAADKRGPMRTIGSQTMMQEIILK